MLGVSVDVWMKNFLQWFIRVLQLILISKEVLKWVSSPMNPYRTFFIQISKMTPCMHQKLIECGKYCMQNNQLPTKTLVEFTYNSIKERRNARRVTAWTCDNNTVTRSKSHIKMLATVMDKPACPWHGGWTHVRTGNHVCAWPWN